MQHVVTPSQFSASLDTQRSSFNKEKHSSKLENLNKDIASSIDLAYCSIND